MSSLRFHQGRLLDHVHVRVADLEAVHHGPARRSAGSVVVEPA